jgi:hypothetical protein
MLLLGSAANDDIVQVNKNAVQTGQYTVDESLKPLARILQTEGHSQKLKKTEMGYHRRLGNVTGCHWYLIVSLPKVQLAEYCAAMKPGGEEEKSWMLGTGYLSGWVTRFRWW